MRRWVILAAVLAAASGGAFAGGWFLNDARDDDSITTPDGSQPSLSGTEAAIQAEEFLLNTRAFFGGVPLCEALEFDRQGAEWLVRCEGEFASGRAEPGEPLPPTRKVALRLAVRDTGSPRILTCSPDTSFQCGALGK